MRNGWGLRGRRFTPELDFGAVVAVSLAIALFAVVAVVWIGQGRARAQANDVSVVITPTGESQPVPPSFFGLSVEDKQITTYENAGPLFDRMVAMLAPRDGSPMLVRLGGRSADEVTWDTPTTGDPSWVRELDPSWMHQLAALARRDHLRVELDLNLAAHAPTMAAAFARAALKALPRGNLAGLAIGNEPDLYRTESWLEKERIASTLASTPRHWTDHYGPKSYLKQYRQYARAVLRAIPGIPLIAPELTYPSVQWPSELIGLGRLAPSAISFHRYATATCKKVDSHPPTPSAFLSNRYSRGLANTLGRDVAFAHAHARELRVTEMNSVTCGGRKHLAESFATALWAPDALFEMMRAGVDGVNWHIRPNLPNAPFHFGATGLEPLPEMYGLAVFARMLGAQPRLEQLALQGPAGVRLKAWAVRSSDGLKILLINKGSTDLVTHLAVGPGRQEAEISRLQAPTLASESGVTFGGQSIGPNGRWHGQLNRIAVAEQNNAYRVRMPAYSAAVVDVGRG